MRELGIFLIMVGIAVPLLGGHLITPRHLGKKYWQLARDFKEEKIQKGDEHHLDAEFSYLDSLVIKGSIAALLFGVLMVLLSLVI